MEAAATIPNDDRAWRVRVDLALCYRMVPHHGLTDLIYTHISARVSAEGLAISLAMSQG